jgi:hypothetical protein
MLLDRPAGFAEVATAGGSPNSGVFAELLDFGVAGGGPEITSKSTLVM